MHHLKLDKTQNFDLLIFLGTVQILTARVPSR